MFRIYTRLGGTKLRAALAAVVIVATVAGPTTVRAEAPSDEAREHYRRGTALYNIGKYVEAAREYEAAYEETSDPPLLFNIGQAYRLAGERRKALTTYRSYLRTAPDGEKRTLALGFIKELEAALATERPTSTDTPVPPAPVILPPPAMEAPAPSAAREAQPTRAPAVRREATATAPNGGARPGGRAWLWAGGAALVVGVAAALFFTVRGTSGPEAPTTDLGTMRF